LFYSIYGLEPRRNLPLLAASDSARSQSGRLGKIKAAGVLGIGAGGVGSPIAMYLAVAGIGKIGIMDFAAKIARGKSGTTTMPCLSWLRHGFFQKLILVPQEPNR
jgi:hypothetical protein